jgi:hypothetical protein
MKLPDNNFGPDLNFVSINSTSAVKSKYNWFKEDIPNVQLAPQDLYLAMLEQRTAGGTAG